MKNLVNDLVTACYKIQDTTETTSINPNKKENYWLIAVAISAIACLLLSVVIIVKYYMKLGLKIPCLFSYQYRDNWIKRNQYKNSAYYFFGYNQYYLDLTDIKIGKNDAKVFLLSILVM